MPEFLAFMFLVLLTVSIYAWLFDMAASWIGQFALWLYPKVLGDA